MGYTFKRMIYRFDREVVIPGGGSGVLDVQRAEVVNEAVNGSWRNSVRYARIREGHDSKII